MVINTHLYRLTKKSQKYKGAYFEHSPTMDGFDAYYSVNKCSSYFHVD